MLNINKHTLCHKRFLSLLPSTYESEDSNKLAIAYFSLASLQLMNTLEKSFTQEEIQSFIKYIYAHLIETDEYSGFRGSLIYNNNEFSINLASTCFAIQCLLILGDDLSKLNKFKIMNVIHDCQMENGGFGNTLNASEDKDLRYCMIAITICKILCKCNNIIEKHINIKSLKSYVIKLQSYDGGFSMSEGDESHSGMVFCGVDTLSIINEKLDSNNLNLLIDFLVHRQIFFNEYNQLEYDMNEYADLNDNGGFNGRLNKYGDTCYVFWCLSSLKLLGYEKYIDGQKSIDFLINKTQNQKMGGFNKTSDSDEFPDPLHSFLGLAALSILNYEGVQKLNCELVIPETAYCHWEKNVKLK